MPALLLPILAKLLPVLIGVAAIFAAYFGIKRKGAQEEREKQADRLQQAQEHVNEAVSQDAAVDARTKEKIEQLKAKQPAPVPPSDLNAGDPFKF